MISLEFSNHIKTFDFKSQRSQVEREAIEAVIAGQSLSSVFKNHGLNFEGRKRLLKTKLGYPHKGEECSLFLLAVICGHVELVRSMIEEQLVDTEQQKTVLVGVHAEQNEVSCGFGYEVGEEVTALWCAAAWCKLDLVKLLVSCGANVNKKSKGGSSPLFMACQYFHSDRSRHLLLGKPDVPVQLELVKYLVENGADVRQSGRGNNTPLTAAALSGFKDPSLIVYLLEKGADPNVRNVHGSTALHFAAEKGCLETVKVLIKHGAQLEAVNGEGLTPLQQACCGCHDEVVDYLISLPDCSRELRIDALELLAASHATSIDTESIEYPSEGDEEYDDETDSMSIQHGYQLMLKAMQERFSHPANVIKLGVKSPLTVYNNQTESQSIEELEALSSNNESIQMEGFIIRDRVLGALQSAEIIQPLVNKAVVLAHKNNLNAAADFYSRALSFKLASSPQSGELFRRFLEHAAGMIESNAELKVANLEPAYQFLQAWLAYLVKNKEKQQGSQFEVDECTWAFDLDMLQAFYFICVLSNVEIHSDEDNKRKSNMIKGIVDLNLHNSYGANMLHLGVWDSIIEVHNKVAMKEMFRVPNLKVLQILVQCGADVNSKDKAGNTPLHILATVDPRLAIVPNDFKENGGKKYVDYFLQNGAELDVKNVAGERPVDVAVCEVTKEFLQIL